MARKRTYSCGTKVRNFKWVRWALNLAHSSNQSEHRIPFILPARGFGEIIKFFSICDSEMLTCNPLGQEFKCHGL